MDLRQQLAHVRLAIASFEFSLRRADAAPDEEVDLMQMELARLRDLRAELFDVWRGRSPDLLQRPTRNGGQTMP